MRTEEKSLSGCQEISWLLSLSESETVVPVDRNPQLPVMKLKKSGFFCFFRNMMALENAEIF